MRACLVVQCGQFAVEDVQRARVGLLKKFSHVTILHLGPMASRKSPVDPNSETTVLDNPAPDLFPKELRAGVGVFDFVSAHRFDEVLFYDCASLAHACIVAKQTGILPPDILLTLFVSSTRGQRNEREGTFISSLQELTDLYFERVSISGCDRLLFGSEDVLNWTLAQGWQLPSRSLMMPERSTELLEAVTGHEAVPTSPDGDPTITIVVTHYNRPRLLAQALSGLAQQTDKSFDVIVVDDGSSSTEAIDFLDVLDRGWPGLDNVRLIRQENKYAGAARNEGLRHVRTSHVIFFDDDNVPKPNMVEVFRRAARLSRADIVSCQLHPFEDRNNAPPDPHHVHGRYGFAGGPIPRGVFENCFGDATGIYKRTVFDRHGFFHEFRGVTFEDWQIYLRAAMAGGRILSLPIPLFWYRIAPGSLLRSTDRTRNYRIISSVLHEKIDGDLRPLIDLMIGQYLEATSPPGAAAQLGRKVEKRTQSIIDYFNRWR